MHVPVEGTDPQHPGQVQPLPSQSFAGIYTCVGRKVIVSSVRHSDWSSVLLAASYLAYIEIQHKMKEVEVAYVTEWSG